MFKPFDPPFLLNAEKSFIEGKIKRFSTNLFINKIYGFIIAIIFNLYIIFSILKNKNLITILFEILLFFLIQYAIIVNLFNIKRE